MSRENWEYAKSRARAYGIHLDADDTVEIHFDNGKRYYGAADHGPAEYPFSVRRDGLIDLHPSQWSTRQ